MKCYKHYERDAVSTCIDCGKGLCPECSTKFNYQLCNSCFLSRVESNKRLLIRNAIMMVILFAVGLYWGKGQEGHVEQVMFAVGLAGIPWGWGALDAITPNVFLFLPLVGWFIYFAIKFSLAMLIGIFVFPVQVYKIVKGLKEA